MHPSPPIRRTLAITATGLSLAGSATAGVPDAPSFYAGDARFINPSTTAMFLGIEPGEPTIALGLSATDNPRRIAGVRAGHAAFLEHPYAILPSSALSATPGPVFTPLDRSAPDGFPKAIDQRFILTNGLRWLMPDLNSTRSIALDASRTLRPANNPNLFAIEFSAVGALEAQAPFPGDGEHFAQALALRYPPDMPSDQATDALDLNNPQAYRWSSSTGLELLGALTTPGRSIAVGEVKRTANLAHPTVVGTSESPLGVQAFHWTPQGMSTLPALPGGDHFAAALNQATLTEIFTTQRTLALGFSNSQQGIEACVWSTNEQGTITIQGLGDLPGGPFQSAACADMFYSDFHTAEQRFLGWGSTPLGQEAFIAGPSIGMIALGDLPGGTVSSVAIAGSGAVVVGSATTDQGRQAFIWTQADGMLNLAELLKDTGLTLQGWQLTEAIAVSGSIAATTLPDDANTDPLSRQSLTIVGNGINPAGEPQPWRAVISAWPYASQPVPIDPSALTPSEAQTLAHWLGAEASPRSPFDLNNNSIIDLQDLNALLASP